MNMADFDPLALGFEATYESRALATWYKNKAFDGVVIAVRVDDYTRMALDDTPEAIKDFMLEFVHLYSKYQDRLGWRGRLDAPSSLTTAEDVSSRLSNP